MKAPEGILDRVNELYTALEKLVNACRPVINELWETGMIQPAQVIRAGEALQEAEKALAGKGEG